MPSKLEEVVNQIAQLQQMRSAGEISESEYIGLKEDVLKEALPGNRRPGPAILDSSLPYDTEGGHDASGLKRAALVIAILAAIAAPIVTAGYYHLLSRVNLVREAGRAIPSPPPKIAARTNAPAPAQAPAQKDDETAPLPNKESQSLALQPPDISDAPKSQIAESLPTAIGQCAETRVAKVTRRSAELSSFGSAIQYKNGGRQISNAQIGGIDASMPGDRIQLCLVSRPRRCPGGGNRGAVYHALNLRTGENWDAPNSEHGCGT